MDSAFEHDSDLENIRAREYPTLKGRTYLDHGGTTLYAKALIDRCMEDLRTNLYGNPHSESTPSALSSRRIQVARRHALEFFNADPEKFDLIFVPNATAAIKMVMDAFRDLAASELGRGQFWYGYHRDAHTSVVGVRQATNGRHRCFHTDEDVESWLTDSDNESSKSKSGEGQLGLFAFPGQSNMTGRRLPLEWSGRLRRSRLGAYTYSLLDASALVTTAPLDLSNVDEAPDFTALSFYKIFGYPDLGALIVRKSSGHILQWRKYFGGGTVDMVVCINDTWHANKDYSTDEHYDLHDQLEDGTLPFHSIFALDAAIDVHRKLYKSMHNISAHTARLAKHLYQGLSTMTHFNGVPVCRIYKDGSATFGDAKTQGATLAFNVQDARGDVVSYSLVERLANDQHIYVRSGGLCNPGGIAAHLQLAPWEMKRAYSAGHRCGHATEIISGKPTGVVRVSLGAMSNRADVDRFLGFMRETFVQGSCTLGRHLHPVLGLEKSVRPLDARTTDQHVSRGFAPSLSRSGSPNTTNTIPRKSISMDLPDANYNQPASTSCQAR